MQYLYVQTQQKKKHAHTRKVSNIFKDENKDTRMMSGASVVGFEHISNFILLLLKLNLNK